jgi:hypothetical protein
MISATAISAPDYGVNMSAINLTQEIINQFSAHGEEDYKRAAEEGDRRQDDSGRPVLTLQKRP